MASLSLDCVFEKWEVRDLEVSLILMSLLLSAMELDEVEIQELQVWGGAWACASNKSLGTTDVLVHRHPVSSEAVYQSHSGFQGGSDCILVFWSKYTCIYLGDWHFWSSVIVYMLDIV